MSAHHHRIATRVYRVEKTPAGRYQLRTISGSYTTSVYLAEHLAEQLEQLRFTELDQPIILHTQKSRASVVSWFEWPTI